MKAIVVTEQAAGKAGMKLVERPDPVPSINDVVVQVHASGFVGTELAWPSTWTCGGSAVFALSPSRGFVATRPRLP